MFTRRPFLSSTTLESRCAHEHDQPEACEELLAQRDLQGAVSAFNAAEGRGAEADRCAGGRWLAHMLGGDFELAWLQSDAIRQRAQPDCHRFWRGDDIRNQRVVLRCLHGFGDAVQLLRYAPRLQALASDLVVEVPPAMLEISPHFRGVKQIMTWGEQAPANPCAWDAQIEVMELPYLFRTRMDELPMATNYLRLPRAAEHFAAHAMGPARAPRVGIVWAAGEWNRERSLPVSLLKPLLGILDCEFWNLQGGSAHNDCRQFAWADPMRDAAICGDGILALAAAISQLDLIITVDTLAAHLAGALGQPVWILLPYAADWRWMTGRDDSPWYPTAGFFGSQLPANGERLLLQSRAISRTFSRSAR